MRAAPRAGGRRRPSPDDGGRARAGARRVGAGRVARGLRARAPRGERRAGAGARRRSRGVARAGLRGLGLAAGEALLVGDTYGEDVAGARAAGLDAAWIDARGQGVPQGAAPPRYVLRALPELAALL